MAMFNYMTPLEGVQLVDKVEIEAEGRLVAAVKQTRLNLRRT